MSAVVLADIALVLANGWDDHMDWGGGWWIVMGLGMILFWVLVIGGIVLLVRFLVDSSGARSRVSRASAPDAEAILERRLAEGEITTEEYRERLAVLRDEPSHGT